MKYKLHSSLLSCVPDQCLLHILDNISVYFNKSTSLTTNETTTIATTTSSAIPYIDSNINVFKTFLDFKAAPFALQSLHKLSSITRVVLMYFIENSTPSDANVRSYWLSKLYALFQHTIEQGIICEEDLLIRDPFGVVQKNTADRLRQSSSSLSSSSSCTSISILDELEMGMKLLNSIHSTVVAKSIQEAYLK